LIGFGEGRHHFFADGDAETTLRFLRKQADGFVGVEMNGAGVGFVFPGDEPEQRRFAHSIGADQTHAMQRADEKIGVFKDRLRAELFVKIFYI